jgi:hypothetical protein
MGLGDPHAPLFDAKDGVSGQDVDMIRLDLPVVGRDMARTSCRRLSRSGLRWVTTTIARPGPAAQD